MSEFTGYVYDKYSSASQVGRSAAVHNATKFTNAAPQYLSRALYIPRHESNSTDSLRLEVYDVSARYAAATKDLALGSSQYVVALSMFQKPPASTDELVCEVDIKPQVGDQIGVVASVRYTGSSSLLPSDPVEVDVFIPRVTTTIANDNDTAAVLSMMCNDLSPPSDHNNASSPMRTSYPIPPSKTRDGTFKHPYFTFQMPTANEDQGNREENERVEWQIHPDTEGRMRYKLVRVLSPEQQQTDIVTDSNLSDPLAIYHHVGVGGSLSLPYSEGVLLLPPHLDRRTEAMELGSLVGMLWRLRELRKEGRKGGKVVEGSALSGASKTKVSMKDRLKKLF